MDFTENTLSIKGYQLTAGNIGSQSASSNPIELVIDNYIEQYFELNNIITKQPTSRGTPGNDWMYREPWEYSVSGVLSSSTLSSSLDFNLDSFIGPNNYLSTKFNQAFSAALGQYIFFVYTGVNSYPSMGISRMKLSRKRESYNCLWIDLSLQELIIPTTSQSYNTRNNSDRPPAKQGIKNG